MTVPAVRENGGARVTVTDTGPERLDRLFEPCVGVRRDQEDSLVAAAAAAA